MNNCPKCGNPLQPGVGTCPICGTVINQAAPAPAAPAPGPAPAPGVANPGVAPATPPVAPAPGAPQAPAPAAQPAPAAPAPVPPAPAVPGAVPVIGAPAPAAPGAPAAPAPGPIPGSPAALAAEAAAQAQAAQAQAQAKAKEKKPFDKKLLIIGGVAAALIVIVAVVIIIINSNSSNNAAPAAPAPTPSRPIATTTNVSVGNYEFSRPTGWTSSENNGYVYISKDDESVVVILNRVSINLANADTDSLKAAAAGQQLQNSEVQEMEINGKKAFFLQATYNNLPVEYYYIDYSPVTVIASVVYTKEEAKDISTAEVSGIVNTVTYVDATKAISTANSYNYQAYIGSTALNNSLSVNTQTNNSSSNNNSNSNNSTYNSSSSTTTTTTTNQNQING